MAEQEQSRSEPATPHKLEQARQKGSVAKSLEANALVGLMAATAWLYLQGLGWLQQQLRLDAAVLSQAHQLLIEPAVAGRWLPQMLQLALQAVLPLMLLLMAVAVLGTLVQVGPVFTTHPLKPDVDRLNPVSGFKRLFNVKLLFELVKSLVKLALVGTVLVLLLQQLAPVLMALLDTDVARYPVQVHGWVSGLLLKLVLALALVTAADLAFTRWKHADDMKMSRRELKDERRQQEGDPHLKRRLKELQRELLQRTKAIRNLPDADVLITNPTHVAVALQYRRDAMAAPKVLAKGAGEFAAHMKQLARRHRVPVIESPPLARELYATVDLERPVPEALYPQVARILLRAYAMRRGAEGAR